MPAYHSAFNSANAKEACGCAILPLRTRARGPAPQLPEGERDIIDETIEYFRANVLFTTFEIQGPADRLLVYGTLFLHQCLKRLEKAPTEKEGARLAHQVAVDSFALPGESGFPITGLIPAPKSNDEKETLRAYLKQFREELAKRLVEKVYQGNARKWWLSFTKRKFMNKELRD